MGAWGITARESDTGLDILSVIAEKCLKPIEFKYFDVKGISDFLNDYFLKRFLRDNKGYIEEGEEYQEYLDDYLSRRRPSAIMLIAECLSEYAQKGVFLIFDYETKTGIRINKFIYTDSVLDRLLEELREMLDPEHWEYKSWFEDDDREKWKAYMNVMCDNLTSLKRGSDNG